MEDMIKDKDLTVLLGIQLYGEVVLMALLIVTFVKNGAIQFIQLKR